MRIRWNVRTCASLNPTSSRSRFDKSPLTPTPKHLYARSYALRHWKDGNESDFDIDKLEVQGPLGLRLLGRPPDPPDPPDPPTLDPIDLSPDLPIHNWQLVQPVSSCCQSGPGGGKLAFILRLRLRGWQNSIMSPEDEDSKVRFKKQDWQKLHKWS